MVGSCQWSCVVGAVDDDIVAQFVDHIGGLSAAPPRGVTVIDLAHGISAPNARQRTAIATAVANVRHKDRILGHAVVTNSAVARGVLTAINWLATARPFPEKVFDAPRPALAWLKERDPELDLAAVLDGVAKEVPSFRSLRW